MPSRDSKRNQQGNYNNNYGYTNGRGGGAPRNHVIPNEPPFTAYIGNAPDSMVQGDFENHLFVGLKIKQVRLVRDRVTDRFRGFGYVDFEDADSLRRAIELDGTRVNDRPLRIDVAARPLGATKAEGFRNKPDFESRDGRRHPSGNNRSNDGYRQGGRPGNNYNQQETSENAEDGYNDEYYAERNRRSSGSGKTNEHRHSQSQQQQQQQRHKTPPRKISNDDVFIVPDTPTSNEDGIDQTNNDQSGPIVARQQSRNWADCPIDESVIEPSPPPSANNTFTSDDFQVVRNKNPKSRNNQHPPSRSMGIQSARGRNHRGGGSQMSGGGRGYYDQIPPQYLNQSQQFYHHQQAPPLPLHMGLSYHNNNNNNNNNRHQQSSGGSRQRVNSNRSNNSRNYNDNNGRSKEGRNDNLNDINNDTVSPENRPRLQLLPRSQKLSSSTDDNQTPEPGARNASIFGSGKPRDERDPKLVELNKHIEEVVEKEQHIPRTKSTTSNGSTETVTKPVRILTAATESLIGH